VCVSTRIQIQKDMYRNNILRTCVTGCNLLSLLLCLVSVFLVFFVYTKYRSDDFVTATETNDFSTLGTCVESVTDEIVEHADFEHESWDCNKEKDKLAYLLMSQTHSIYYLHLKYGSEVVTSIAMTLVSSTLGYNSTFVNRSAASEVLRMLDDDDVKIPSNCTEIYTGAVPVFYDTLNQKLPEIACNSSMFRSLSRTNLNSVEIGNLLYACNKQFSFGQSGPRADTYGIPFLNEPAGPDSTWWSSLPITDRFNSTSAWSVKSRVFLGVRFGWSLFAYVPTVMSLGVLTTDAGTVLLVLMNGGRFKGYGWERPFVLCLSVASSITSMFWGIWIPWGGMWSPRLGRPLCEEWDDSSEDTVFFDYMFYMKTRGGWKPDGACLYCEFLVVVFQIFALIVVCVSGWYHGKHRKKDTSKSDEVEKEYDGQKKRKSTNRYCCFVVVSVFVSGFGLLCVIASEWYEGVVFGDAWVRSISGESVAWKYFYVTRLVYDMNLNTLVAILFGGGLIGSIIGKRTLMSDVHFVETKSSAPKDAVVFFVWLVISCATFAVFLGFYVSYNTEDCEMFPENGQYDTERSSCVLRFSTSIVGTILIGLVVVIGIAILVCRVGPLRYQNKTVPEEVEKREGMEGMKENASSTTVYRGHTKKFVFDFSMLPNAAAVDDTKDRLLSYTTATYSHK